MPPTNTDAAYWAGVVDSYGKMVNPRRITLQAYADWRIVEGLAGFLGGDYRKEHLGSPRRGYDVWVVTIRESENYLALLKFSRSLAHEGDPGSNQIRPL